MSNPRAREDNFWLVVVVGGAMVGVVGVFATVLRWLVGAVVGEMQATTREVMAAAREGQRQAIAVVGKLAIEVAESVAKSVGVGVRGGDNTVLQPERQEGEDITLPWFLKSEDGQPFDPTDETLQEPISWEGKDRVAVLQPGEDPLHDLTGEEIE